jgi:hypothetical protein
VASASLGALPASGSSGRRWLYRATGDGVTKVLLRSLGSRAPGRFKVVARARRWFTAAAANQPAAATSFVLRVGGQCFSHPATRKSG